MIRADLTEDGEALMARFITGLNPEIGEIVELQYYLEIGYLVEKAIKIKRQLKARRSQSYTSNTNRAQWRDSRTLEKRETREVPKVKGSKKYKRGGFDL